MQSLPVSTEAPRSAPMTSSSSTFRSNAAHVRRSDLTLSIVHPSDAGTLSAEFISCIELSEQPSWGNYPVLPPQAGHYSDQLGGVQGINGIDSVQRQQIPGSLTDPTETNDGNEWSMYLDLDDITIPDIVDYRMAGSSHVSVPSNSETLHNMVQQSVAVPSNSELLYPIVSANEQTHSPKRPRVRMRWTMEMHNLFVDAVKQLGGSENAKPKAILDIMNVEGLTRDQVKSHLQKYKSALSRHNSPEGSLVGTITPSEAVQLDVQIMQLEFQKKLHEMLEKTRRDILELHTSMLGELEKRRTLSVDSTTQVPGEGTSTRIAPRMQPVMHRRLPHMIAMLEHDRAFYAAFSCSHVNNIRISSGQ